MKIAIQVKCLAMLLTAIFSTIIMAQDRLDMEGASIVGNKELPNMLYIVPWKATERIDFPSPPVVSIMDQALTTIDRSTFKRQIRYHAAIFPASLENQ